MGFGLNFGGVGNCSFEMLCILEFIFYFYILVCY